MVDTERDPREHPVQSTRAAAEAAAERELATSNASLLMEEAMLANAIAHDATVDLDRLHEESLAVAAEIDAERQDDKPPER